MHMVKIGALGLFCEIEAKCSFVENYSQAIANNCFSRRDGLDSDGYQERFNEIAI